MILPGHLSATLLVSAVSPGDRRGLWWAAMFPDMVDKPLHWLFRVTPNDRLPAHSGTAWALSTVAVWRLGGGALARSWVQGYGVHLLCDALNARLNRGRVYWLWPFKRYQFHVGPTGLASSLRDFGWRSLLIEAGLTLLGLACLAARASRRHSDLRESR